MSQFLLLVSCKKDDSNDVNENLTTSVSGTYKGDITNVGGTGSTPATSDVSFENDYTIKVHCYGGDFDTTIMLELYKDGNNMRVCFTDNQFNQEYGHHMSENHHMMGNNGSYTNWDQHMSNEHDNNDIHYGSFNTDNHSFDYTFKIHSDSGNYNRQFTGTRQ